MHLSVMSTTAIFLFLILQYCLKIQQQCSYNIRFLHGSTKVNEAKSKLKPKFYMFKNVSKVLLFNYEVLKPKNKNLLKIPNQKHPTLNSIK